MTQPPFGPPPYAGPPPFVGPPPTPPREPRVHQPLHVVHLILSIVTAGFWLLIWGMAAMNASAANEQERKRYDDEKLRYIRDYDAWQRRYHQVYGIAPHPMQY